MAKIFSWALKNDKETTGYAYLAGLGSGYCTKDKIEDSTKLKEIANEVSQYTWDEYKDRFKEMVDEAERDYGVSRSLFKDASFYYNVGGSIIMLSGADGVSNNAGLTCAIFRNEDKGKTLTVDDTPTFGNVYYDKISKKLKGLEKGWTDNAESRSSGQVTWMSSAYFRDTENGEQITNWCTPILITGEDGRDGSDGKNSEFIYALTKDDKEQPKYPKTEAERKALFDFLAESSEPRVVDGTKWWDRAQAIDPENYLAEWVWTRFKKTGSDEWVYTERPVIWALWGSDGTDGDGIEYIFQRTHTTDERPTPLPKPLKDYFDIQTWKEEYNKDEYIPDDWSDNPMGVDKDYQCEWVSTRKYTKQEKGKYDFYDYIENKDKMAWGEFSDPVIWSNHSKKGISTYTSFIFTRTNDTKITTYHVHGGTYDDPLEGIETREADDVTIVSDIKWDDTVPGGNAPVYTCRRVFSDEDTGEKSEWSQPVLMADNPNFQVEYSQNYVKDGFGLPSLNQFIEKKNKYTITIDASKGEQHAGTWVVSGKYNDEEGVNEEAWRDLCVKAGYGVWKDVNDDGPDAIEPVYMATARRVDNNWSDWVISKIKGEKGERGESIQLKGSVVIEEDLKSDPDVDDRPSFANDTEHYNVNDLGCAFYDDDKDPKFYEYVQMWVFNTQKKWEKLNGEVGDCYYTPTHGHLVKWNDEKNGWEDAGLFKGEPGESGTTYYLHTAYANEDPNGTYVILNDGTGIRLTRLKEGAGKYFGVYTDTILDDEEDLSKKWQWARWNGEDGYGMEQIFRLGTAENVPFVPTEETPYDEEPLGWSDSPIEPTRDQIICYTCHRRYSKSKQWKGTEDGHALVYNRYVENGLSAAVLSISNDSLSTLVDEENKTLINDTEESPIHFVYGITEIDIKPEKVTISGVAAEHWEAYYSPEKKAVITQIKPGKALIETKDGKEIVYNNIQVNVEATVTDGGVDRVIRGEAHIMIRGIQSDHLYEISTDRDTIHKDSYGGLIAGQKEIYLFLNKQYNNSGVGKIIPITQIPEERDWHIYYAIDGGERQEITEFTPTEYIKGVSTAITVFNTDIQEKPNNSIQIITEMVTNDGKHVITDTETIKVVNNGKDGQDASEIEYVYHIYPTGTKVTIEKNLSQEHGRIHDPDNPEAFIETDDYKRNDDWMPSDKQGSFWTDHPVSIGVGQEEWCAIRYKKGGDEGWGNFEAPFIWSAYGISGRDGDGVEYVYYINNGETPTLNQNTGYYWDSSKFIKTTDRQHEDFLPAAEDPVTTEQLHWTDEPGSVTKNNPVQWVAKRKFHDATPEGGTKEWDYFSEPTVWNNYSETGVDVDFTNDKALIGTDEDTILDKETTAETDIFMKYGLDYCNNLAITNLTYNGVSTVIPTIGGTSYTQIGTTGKVGLKLSRKTVDGAQYIHFNFKLSAGLDLTEPIYIGVNLSGKNQQGLSVVGTNTFAIAGLKGGDEAVQYNIVVNPHGVSVNSAGIFNVSELTITVNKTEGKNPPTPLTGLTSTQKLYYTVGNSTSETLLTYGKTGAKLNITTITEGTVNFKFKVNNIVVDEEAIHIVRDGQGSLTADLDNENVLIGTGSDSILGKDSFGHVTTLLLRDGTGYCTDLGLAATHVVNGDRSFSAEITPEMKPIEEGSKIKMKYAKNSNTGLTFTMDLYSELDLSDPYAFTFVVTGKTQSGTSVQASTTFTLAGLKDGKEALHYHLTTTPSGINISKDGSWSSKNINVKVQRIDGDVVTDVTSGEVSWGVNNESLTRKLSLSSTGATLTQNAITAVTLSPKTVTFSFTENGFVETETLYIVKDGKDGKDGMSAYRFDLNNQAATINCDSNGNILSGAIRPHCTATLYLGSEKVTGATYSISSTSTPTTGLTINSSTGVLTFNNGTASQPFNFNTNTLEITIQAKINNVLYGETIMTVSKALAGTNGNDAVSYHLNLSANAIQVNNAGVANPSTISVIGYKQVGENPPTIADDCIIKWGYNIVNPSSGNTSAVTITNIDTSKNYITFQMLHNDVQVDLETVPILHDGIDSLGVVKADFSNDILNVGTGKDYILETKVQRQSQLTLQAGGYCTEVNLIGKIVVKHNESTTEFNVASNIEFDLQSKSNLTINGGNTSAITVTTNLLPTLDLTYPYDITFTATGKTTLNGVVTPVTGSTVLSIVGIKGGAEGESYDIILNPSGIQTDAERTSWSATGVTVSVRHTIGNKAESATGQVKYHSDNYSTSRNISVGGTLNITSDKYLKQAKSITFEYTNGDFHDVETLLITSDGKNGDKGNDSVIYQIICDPDTVNISTGGTYNPSSINVKLLQISGETITSIAGKTLYWLTDKGWEGEIETQTNGVTFNMSSAGTVSNVLTFTYDDKWSKSVSIVRNGQGADGYPGCVYRRSVWQAGKTYHNDTDVKPEGNTPRYIDAVFNTEAVGPEQIGDLRCWVCKKTHDSNETNNPKTDSEESKKVWEELSVEDPFYSPLILAKQISADMIDVRSILTSKLFADEAIINRLRTSESGKRVIVENNALTMYDTQNNIRLSVSGENLGLIPSEKTYTIQSQNIFSVQKNDGEIIKGGQENFSEKVILSSFTVDTGVANVIKLDITLKLYGGSNGVRSGSFEFICRNIIVYIDGKKQGQSNGLLISGEVNTSSDEATQVLQITTSVSPGEHNVSIMGDYSWYCTSGPLVTDGTRGWTFNLEIKENATLYVTYPIEKVEIGANGFRSMFNSGQKFEAIRDISNGDISFVMENGTAGVKVDKNILYIKHSNSWYKASREYNSTLGGYYLKLT